MSSVNKFFYHEIIIIDKLMLIDGEPYEVDPEFGINFLNYELRNLQTLIDKNNIFLYNG